MNRYSLISLLNLKLSVKEDALGKSSDQLMRPVHLVSYFALPSRILQLQVLPKVHQLCTRTSRLLESSVTTSFYRAPQAGPSLTDVQEAEIDNLWISRNSRLTMSSQSKSLQADTAAKHQSGRFIAERSQRYSLFFYHTLQSLYRWHLLLSQLPSESLGPNDSSNRHLLRMDMSGHVLSSMSTFSCMLFREGLKLQVAACFVHLHNKKAHLESARMVN